ncbi:MAG: hypothetical protein ABGX05_15410 [Pirellulaceae bacterium]
MSEQPSPPPAAPTAASRILVLLAAMIVLGPVISKEYPHEIARWHHAAARQLWLDGSRELALESMVTALSWDPSNVNILSSRAQWLGELEHYEQSLADWNRAIRMQPDRAVFYQQRCDTYLHLKRSDRVLEDWETIMQLYREQGFPGSHDTGQRFNVYNNRAYQLGVANINPATALEDANRAIDLLGGDAAMLDIHGFSQYLQTYELYLEGQFATALMRANLAITWSEKSWHQWQRSSDPRWQPETIKLHQQRTLEFKRYRATLYLLRSHIHEQLDHETFRQQDLKQIQSLGCIPDKLELPFAGDENPLIPLLELQTLLGNKRQYVDARSMILDTRGFILWRQNQHQAALWDLELAVHFATAQHRMSQDFLQHQKEIAVDLRPLEQELRLIHKNLAVILYHRSLAYQALQQPLKASQDHQRIRDLGYQVSPHLF